MLGVKNFSVEICDDAPSTARSSYMFVTKKMNIYVMCITTISIFAGMSKCNVVFVIQCINERPYK